MNNYHYSVEKLEQPVRACGEVYPWVVRSLASSDGGKTWWYSGYGSYCRTENEALNTVAELMRRES